MSKRADSQISKTLSWLLRHSAEKEGLTLSPEGYIRVSELIQHRNLRGKCTLEDIERIVQNNDKQRFSLRKIDGIYEIRANQGHSVQSVDKLELVPILKNSGLEIGDVIHGTYFKFLDSIKKSGLSRMRRNHIHFSTGLPTSRQVISGARRDAEVFVYIDVLKALNDGIEFYKSANGVILSSGNKSGFLEPKYFLKVCKADGSVVM